MVSCGKRQGAHICVCVYILYVAGSSQSLSPILSSSSLFLHSPLISCFPLSFDDSHQHLIMEGVSLMTLSNSNDLPKTLPPNIWIKFPYCISNSRNYALTCKLLECLLKPQQCKSRNNILIWATTWINLGNMLNKRDQLWKAWLVSCSKVWSRKFMSLAMCTLSGSVYSIWKRGPQEWVHTDHTGAMVLILILA